MQVCNTLIFMLYLQNFGLISMGRFIWFLTKIFMLVTNPIPSDLLITKSDPAKSESQHMNNGGRLETFPYVWDGPLDLRPSDLEPISFYPFTGHAPLGFNIDIDISAFTKSGN